MIALDYCHKIKCYFNGISEDEIRRGDQSSKNSAPVGEDKEKIRAIVNMFNTVSNLKSKIEKKLAKSESGNGSKVKYNQIIVKVDRVKNKAL